MSTFVLIPGAGSDSWYWHLVEPRLQALGHQTVAVDLPSGDDRAGLVEYTDAVVAAIDAHGDRRDLIVVAQSLGGFTGPLVCDRVPVDLLVLLAAMVPSPGEAPGDWWANTGHGEAIQRAADEGGWSLDDEAAVFTHDLDPELAAGAFEHSGDQSGTPMELPWPLDAWPDVPTRFLLCRDDRFFPAEFQRRVVKERLGFEPDEMAGGHMPALAQPDELVAWLERYRGEVGST